MLAAPVKNTFIHFDYDSVERPQKMRRNNSAPDKLNDRTYPKSDVLDDQDCVPVQKRQRRATIVDDSKTVAMNDHDDKQMDCGSGAARGREAVRSRSRSEAHSDGNALTEEERVAKAQEFVTKLKQTEGYKAYLIAREKGEQEAMAAPRTPNPYLRSSSKRKWERQMMAFRQSLRRWGPVTVSMEDEDET